MIINYSMLLTEKQLKHRQLLSGKIDKYDYFTGEEILPSGQSRMIEQAKFAYSPLEKVLEKQTKTIEDQGRKQIDAIMNQNNKDFKNLSHKKVFEEIAK